MRPRQRKNTDAGRAFLVAVLLLGGCASEVPREPKAADASPPPLPARIIDAHTHFTDTDEGPSEKMVAALRKAGAVAAVVHSRYSGKLQRVRRDSPVRIALCAALVLPVMPAKVEAGLKAGTYACMKVYLGYVPRWANDSYYHPFYRLAEKYHVPVVFHTGDTIERDALVKYTDPLTIDEIAVKYRKVNFVIAHLGNPWINSAAEVIYKNPNVYGEVSAIAIGDLIAAGPETVDEVVVKPLRYLYAFVASPKKIIFGSDWPLVDIADYAAAIRKAIPPKDRQAVFYDNAERVFPSLAEPAPKK